MLYGIKHVMGVTQDDYNKFANDKSGRLAKPLLGTEDTAPDKRYWAAMHSITHKYLCGAGRRHVPFATGR